MKLKASKRDLIGKKSKRLRREGLLPAVVYGHHTEPVPVSLDAHEFEKVFSRSGRSQLLDLLVDGGGARKVLVKEVQVNPRRNRVSHVDLFEVSLREKVTVEVQIHTVGEAPAVKRGDGELLVNMHTIRIEALPGALPESIQVDISSLDEVEAGIRVQELQLPEGVTVLADPEELVVKVARGRVAEEVPVDEAAAAAAAAAAAEGAGEAAPEATSEG